jgi:hypothetical protein
MIKYDKNYDINDYDYGDKEMYKTLIQIEHLAFDALHGAPPAPRSESLKAILALCKHQKHKLHSEQPKKQAMRAVKHEI